MYRVLLPIDTDQDRVNAQATAVVELAGVTTDLEATLLHVFDDREEADTTAPTQLTTGRNARDRLEEAGVRVEESSRTGTPAEVILETAREIGADQIVLGGRKRSSLGALVFGSVSQDVVLAATQPVTITGSAEDLERPSHRCTNCGETYYTTPDTEISTCRNCGGVNVEELGDESTAEQPTE